MDQSSSRVYVTKRDLLAAFWPDIREILTVEYQEAATDITHFLLILYNPMRLFEFVTFIRVFAR